MRYRSINSLIYLQPLVFKRGVTPPPSIHLLPSLFSYLALFFCGANYSSPHARRRSVFNFHINPAKISFTHFHTAHI